MVKHESVVFKSLSCFNPYFLIFSSFLKMPKTAKSKSINIAKKWKQQYVKQYLAINLLTIKVKKWGTNAPMDQLIDIWMDKFNDRWIDLSMDRLIE